MSTQPTDQKQGLLMELPEVSPPGMPAVTEPGKFASAPTSLTTLATVLDVIPDATPGVVLVDPRAIAIDPVNVRHGLSFDAEARGELIASMRNLGNTVPVRLRPAPNGGLGFLCPSGSQRLGAALHIQRDDPAFRLRAVVAETMTDDEAFAIAEADNAGRSAVSAMQQARHWAATLETVYGGNRQAFIAATGRSASSVSRTLALVALPDHVLACCADVEALTPYFAEQLVPRLADPAEEPAIRRRAEALKASGRRLPGAALVRALLTDTLAKPAAALPVWASADGSSSMKFTADRKGGGRVDVAGVGTLSALERRTALKALDALFRSLVG